MIHRRIISSLLFLALVGLVAGCGSATASLSGKVTYKNEPVAEATVTIMGSDGIPIAAMTDSSGTYTITDIKVNGDEYSITVMKIAGMNAGGLESIKKRGLPPAEGGVAPPPPSKDREAPKNNLPLEYSDFGSTPLKGIKLNKGKNEKDLPL
jgi:hypothetical protein